MSNVIDIFKEGKIEQDSLRERLFPQESPLYFKVWERPLFFKGGIVSQSNDYAIESHKAVVRQHPIDGQPPVAIGIVGKNYKVLPMHELCTTVEQTFVDRLSYDQIKDVQSKDQVSYLGGTCIRDYIFPNIQADIGSSKSDIAFRVIVINGYDGSSSFRFYSGAIDVFCSNGMVSGVFDLITKRHTAGLQVPALAARLEKSIDIFYTQAKRWKKWVGTEITDEDAKVCFEAMPNISERRIEQLLRQFRIECQTHGRTVWALYSAATQYASHDSSNFAVRNTGNDSKAATLSNRELQVRNWTSSEEFVRIAA